MIDDKIFCCHGGLSPDLYHIGQIRAIERPIDVPNQGKSLLILFIYLEDFLFWNTQMCTDSRTDVNWS